jgi:cytidine deaminase
LEPELYNAAIDLIKLRYPSGWGGAAAVCLLEANKLNKSVTHSLCVYRESEEGEFVILSPCGICQERLIHWGAKVKVAITNPQNKLQFVALKKLMPHHWSQVNKK